MSTIFDAHVLIDNYVNIITFDPRDNVTAVLRESVHIDDPMFRCWERSRYELLKTRKIADHTMSNLSLVGVLHKFGYKYEDVRVEIFSRIPDGSVPDNKYKPKPFVFDIHATRFSEFN